MNISIICEEKTGIFLFFMNYEEKNWNIYIIFEEKKWNSLSQWEQKLLTESIWGHDLGQKRWEESSARNKISPFP